MSTRSATCGTSRYEIGAEREHQQATDDVDEPARGEIEHRQEHAEEEQRRAEVVHQHEQRQRAADHQRERGEMLEMRQADAQHALLTAREQLALLAQVGRHEQHEPELRELARLEGEPADADPDARPVHDRAGRVGGGDRRREREQGGHAEQVAVALEHAVVRERRQHCDEAADADRQPDRLIAGAGRIEAVDLDDADGDEQAAAGSSTGSASGSATRSAMCATPEQREERRGVGQRERRDDAGARHEHGGEPDRHDGGDEQEQAELAIAARAQADGTHGSVCSSFATRERADSLERREWSKRRLRRAAGNVAAGMRLTCTSENSLMPPPRSYGMPW